MATIVQGLEFELPMLESGVRVPVVAKHISLFAILDIRELPMALCPL